jgi:hypothetical protein
VFSALKTGLVLCMVGMIVAVNAVFIVPLIAGRICDLQPDILHNLQSGKDCIRVVAVGFHHPSRPWDVIAASRILYRYYGCYQSDFLQKI